MEREQWSVFTCPCGESNPLVGRHSTLQPVNLSVPYCPVCREAMMPYSSSCDILFTLPDALVHMPWPRMKPGDLPPLDQITIRTYE